MPIYPDSTVGYGPLKHEPPMGEGLRPRRVGGPRPGSKSHPVPLLSVAARAAAPPELLRPGSVRSLRPIPIETAISAVIANQSRVCPASRAAFDTCLRLAMLTITAVTISGGTRTL